jgi:hypothetical protein
VTWKVALTVALIIVGAMLVLRACRHSGRVDSGAPTVMTMMRA